MKKIIIILSAAIVLTITNIPSFSNVKGINSLIASNELSIANSENPSPCFSYIIEIYSHWEDECQEWIEDRQDCYNGNQVWICSQEICVSIANFCNHTYEGPYCQEFNERWCPWFRR